MKSLSSPQWGAGRARRLAVWGAAFFLSAAAILLVVAGIAFGRITPEAQRLFDGDFLEKALAYNRARYLLWAAKQAITVMALFLAALFAAHRFPSRGALNAALWAFFILVFLEAVAFPVDYLRGFWLEHRFGLSNQSFSLWLGDRLRWLGLSVAVLVPGLTLLHVGLQRVPSAWWALAGAGYGAYLLAATFLTPLVVDPLFHEFRPLDDPELEARVVEMANAAELEVDEVLVMDASRRTSKANAYFTGVGKSKRIVLYDNLLEGFERDETELVIAHEMAHWKYGHVAKGLLAQVVLGFGFFWLFEWMARGGGYRLMHPLGVHARLLLLSALLGLAVLPAQNWVSRRYETASDQMAIELTKNAAAQVRLEKNLSISNLSDVDPHPLVKAVLFTHPPAVERIALGERALGK